MARDYKPKRRKPGGFSGWAGLVLGLGMGLAVAGVVYFKDHRLRGARAAHREGRQEEIARRRPAELGSGDSGGVADAGGTERPGKPYDFYDMLPKFEVVVPEKDKDVKRDILPAPETRRGTYVLQAGSYKNFADADRVRAQLALQGIESKVQKVSVDNDTWHRIRIGPIRISTNSTACARSCARPTSTCW
jgi:hypothetical protein